MLSITSHEYLQKAEVLVDSWILRILKTVFVELLWLYCSSFCARLVNFSELQVISIITDLKKIRNVNRLLPIELSKDKIWSLPELTPLFFALFLHYCSHPQNSPFFSAAFYSATILIFWKIFFYHQYLRIIPQIHMITENSFVICKCHHETVVTTHHTRQKVVVVIK